MVNSETREQPDPLELILTLQRCLLRWEYSLGKNAPITGSRCFYLYTPPPSFLYCMNPAAWQQVDVGRCCPKGQKISPCHVPVLATCAHDLMLQTPQLGSSG